jgi:hypothetical protein
MEEGDRLDEAEKLGVITAGSNSPVGKHDVGAERVHHQDRPKEPLGVLVKPDELGFVSTTKAAFEGCGPSLPFLNPPGLLGALVHRSS